MATTSPWDPERKRRENDARRRRRSAYLSALALGTIYSSTGGNTGYSEPEIPSGGGSSTTESALLTAPTLTLATGNLVYPPEFNIGLDDTAQVNDTLRLQWDNNADFSSLTGDVPNPIDAGEAAANAATFTGLSSITSGTNRFRVRLESGAFHSAWSNVVTQGPDDLAPALTSPTSSGLGATFATIGVTTDEANGTIYWVVTTSSTAPTKAQVKLGQNHLGAAAVDSGSAAVTSTGAKTFPVDGTTASTAYYYYFMHEDAATNQSTIANGTYTSLATDPSLATLWQGAAGLNRNSFTTVTNAGLSANGSDGLGERAWVRSVEAMPAKAHFEGTITELSAANAIHIGVCDAGLTLNGVYPAFGEGTTAGFEVEVIQSSGNVIMHRNGATESVVLPVANPAANDIFAFDIDRAANTVRVTFKRGATATLLGTWTLTSLIPTTWTAAVGLRHNDTWTVNFGASAFAVTPQTGHTGW